MLNRLIPFKSKKWSTLAGGLILNLSLGLMYSFGNMSPYLTSYLRVHVDKELRFSDLMWVFTATCICVSVTSFFTGLLKSYWTIRLKVLIAVGSLILSSGIGLTYFALQSSLGAVIFTYGIVTGVGTGLAYLSSLSIAMKWFPNSKGFANSVVLFGYGAHGVIFVYVQSIYINPDNIAPDESYSSEFPDEKYFSSSNKDLLDRVPFCCLIMAVSFFLLQFLSLLLMSDYDVEKSRMVGERTSLLVNHKSDNNSVDTEIDVPVEEEVNSLGVRYQDPDDGITIKTALKLAPFWIIVLIDNFSSHAPKNVVATYKNFGMTFIKDESFLMHVGSISNLFNCFGRLFWGVVVDRVSGKLCLLAIQTLLLAFCSTLYFTQVFELKEMYMVWICVILFAQCATYTVLPTTMANSFGQKNFYVLYGFSLVLNIGSTISNKWVASEQDALGWFWFYFVNCCFGFISWAATFFFNVKKSDGTDI